MNDTRNVKGVLMKQIQFQAVGLVAIGLLAGCSKKPEVTVDWYLAHKEERTAKVAQCQGSAELAATPDCMNAIKAKDLALINKSGPSAADTFEFKPNKVPGATGTKRE